MKLDENEINKIIKKLKNQGLKGEFEDISYLSTKHYSGYLNLINFANSKGLNPTVFIIQRLYRADIVCKRIINERLIPIELKIGTSLMNFIEFHNQKIKASNLIPGKLLESWDGLKSNVINRKISTLAFINKQIRKNIKVLKLSSENWYLSINNLYFSHIYSILSLMKEDDVQKIMNSTAPKLEILTWLEQVVALRNHIAHIGQLLTTNKVYIKNKSFNISSWTKSLIKIGYGDLKKELNSDIKFYEKNSYNKYMQEGGSEEGGKQIRLMFGIIIKHLGIML